MHSNEFEYAFSEFLDRHEYDEAEHALFSIVRTAFQAGWLPAGRLQKARKFFSSSLPNNMTNETSRFGEVFFCREPVS